MDSTDENQALGRRIRLLTLIEGVMGIVLSAAGLLLLDTASDRIAVSVVGLAVLAVSAGLFFLRHRRSASTLTTINFLLIISLVAAVDPLGKTVSGASWSLFLIWPSIAVLVLRNTLPSVVVSGYALGLLILVPTLEFSGVIPVEILGDPNRLQVMLVVHVVVLVALTTVTLFIARSERRAYESSVDAQGQLASSALALREANESLQRSNQALQTSAGRQEQLVGQVQLLETPLIRLSDQALFLPLVGLLDEQRIDRMSGGVLERIHDQRAATLIVDMTGVVISDAQMLPRFAELLRAAQLLGCVVRITGLSAEVVAELVNQDIDLALFGHVGQLNQMLLEVFAPQADAAARHSRARLN
jgi:rsbT co-antagonist protein RsbR